MGLISCPDNAVLNLVGLTTPKYSQEKAKFVRKLIKCVFPMKIIP